ncbi:MAG: PBP1A family penicillin-binding protein [Pyrinomonadaceae bacterium]|nr:PBP1A family penicillin-binding protein [Pyrinomonadaceae bacterium]
MASEISVTNKQLFASAKHETKKFVSSPRPFLKVIPFLRYTILGCIVISILSSAILLHFYREYARLVDQRLASGYLVSRAGIYAAPRVLRVGERVSPERLVEILRQSDYVQDKASNVWNGSFTIEGERVRIQPRQMNDVGSSPSVNVTFNKDRIASLTTNDNHALPSYALEPQLLTNDSSMKTDTRAALSYADIPPVLARAILAAEDHRFFEHRGVDVQGILRALWNNARDEGAGQGGSTITQQLVKNTYLSPERTYKRKFAEAMIATALERRLSKEDIFALYCNEIYLGTRGTIGVRGVAQAARVFFDKELKDLSLAEAATIAGMIQSPGRHAPDRHPEDAQARRNLILNSMQREGYITNEEALAAAREFIAVAPHNISDAAIAPYFIDYVNRTTEAKLQSQNLVDESNLRIHTTIDLDLQQSAEAALKNQLERLGRVYHNRGELQGALVALNPRTGEVLAMVGGRDYAQSQLNRATDARRQPGSVFKPFVYATALEANSSPVAMYKDAPREFTYDRNAHYRPANYGNSYSMRDVTMREGLVRSLNVVTVDVAMNTGLDAVANTAARFGLPRPAPYPALALGTTETTPLEIAAAYAAFANGGRRIKPFVVAEASDSQGTSFIQESATKQATIAGEQVIRPTTAYMITDMLEAVIDHGTARAARGFLKGVAVAGKTGTSRDGWFVGYTPNLVCVVWVGFDSNAQLGLTGAESALPVWTQFMREAVELRPELGGAAFERPAGINMVEVDPITGMRATPDCPNRERIAVTSLIPFDCYTHNSPSSSVASLDNTESYDAAITSANATTIYTDGGRAAARQYIAPRSLPDATRAPDVRASGATQIEKSKHGSPTLVNNLRINTSP